MMQKELPIMTWTVLFVSENIIRENPVNDGLKNLLIASVFS
ncbi:hypothetical protein ACQKIC_05340 [Peribacillus sp. NPDC046944]